MATPGPDPHGASLKLPGDISKTSQRRNVKDPSRACTTQNPITPEPGCLPWETNWGRATDGEGIQSGSWLKGHQGLEVGIERNIRGGADMLSSDLTPLASLAAVHRASASIIRGQWGPQGGA